MKEAIGTTAIIIIVAITVLGGICGISYAWLEFRDTKQEKQIALDEERIIRVGEAKRTVCKLQNFTPNECYKYYIAENVGKIVIFEGEGVIPVAVP